MKRHLKFLALLLVCPLLFAFLWVFGHALLGLEFKAETEWMRAYSYAGGVVIGAWLWGAA